MRAVVYDRYGETPRLVDVPPPTCPADGVVIDVAATGVCRSDWHAWTGSDPVPLPMTPGHELAGVIAAVGPTVRAWKPGDRVTVPFACGCGRCQVCLAGDTHVCPAQTQPGFTSAGSFAEQVAIAAADTNLVALPSGMDFIAAAALGCRFATAFRAVVTQGRTGPGDWVAVYGCGGVGLSAVMIAVALGARVVAVDVSPAARAMAAELGAEAAVDPGALHDVAAELVAATGGGARVSLDAVGSPATASASMRCLRPGGRHVQVGLLLGPNAQLPVPMDRVVSAELEILGSHGMPSRDYPAMLSMVASGVLRPEALVTRVIGLAEAGAALAAMGLAPQSPGMTVVAVT